MQYSQTKIRLSHDTISNLKAHAEKRGLTYSSMCEQILEDGVAKLDELDGGLDDENYFLLASNALRARMDIENSRKRSQQSKLEKQHVSYPEHPEEAAAYIYNQLRDVNGFS
jgi:predicted DNA-binding protein